MKKLFIYIVLFVFSFSAFSFADDISDFQIEGMSIGGSLLDYMPEKEIKENIVAVYPDKKFSIVMIKSSTKIYDSGVGITYKSNDKTYKIHGVQGRVSFENDIEGCYKTQDEIEKELSSIFDETKKDDWGILDLKLQGAAAKGSTFKGIAFDFNNGDSVTITCYYYSDDPVHMLKISMTSSELSRYLEQ